MLHNRLQVVPWTTWTEKIRHAIMRAALRARAASACRCYHSQDCLALVHTEQWQSNKEKNIPRNKFSFAGLHY